MRVVLRVVRALVPILVSGALSFGSRTLSTISGVWPYPRHPGMDRCSARRRRSLSASSSARPTRSWSRIWRGVGLFLSRTLPINFLSLFLTLFVPIAVLADVARIAASCRMLKLTPA